jgi:hypothetical protein
LFGTCLDAKSCCSVILDVVLFVSPLLSSLSCSASCAMFRI